jgi:hypothetical protein
MFQDEKSLNGKKKNTKSLTCQLCLSRDSLTEILDLGHQPICNALLSADNIDEPEITYPLKLFVCKNCHLVQLLDVVSARTVFCHDYNYLSGSTPALVRYYHSLAERVTTMFNLGQNDFVCDIGSNDGTFLVQFKDKHVKVIGVEPTPFPARIARENGVPTYGNFFTKKISHKIVRRHGTMRVVTAMNVLAHNDDVHGFLDAVITLMDKKSVFISQSHYLASLIQRLEYDTIYHEHLRYYTLSTLKKLFDQHGLNLFRAEKNDVYGGSILTFCSLDERTPEQNVAELLSTERKFEDLDLYREFSEKIKQNSRELTRLLLELKDAGKRIVGIGAPMKASTMLNYCRIGPEILDYLAEVNPLKIGKYSPGSHIPIVDESVLFHSQPDYALIFSWNVSEDIITKFRQKGYNGKFIIPIPTPTVIG